MENVATLFDMFHLVTATLIGCWKDMACVKETIFAPGSTYLENCGQKVSRVEVNFWWAFTPQGPSAGGTNGGVQAHHLFHPQPVRSLFFHLLIDIAWIRWMRKARRDCWLGQIVSLLQQSLQTNCLTGSPSAFSSNLTRQLHLGVSPKKDGKN